MKAGFIAVVGRPNVGKSTLINKLVSEKVAIVSDKAGTTRDNIKGILNFKDNQYIFIDTPGIHKPQHLLGEYMTNIAVKILKDVDIILFLIDASKTIGTGDMFVMDRINENAKKKPKILLVNKVDLISDEQKEEKLKEIEEKLGEFNKIIFVSGMYSFGISQLLEALDPYLEEGVKYYPDDMYTDMSTYRIITEIVREKILLKTRDEIPHSVAIEIINVERKEGKKDKFDINIYVERDSQKGIINIMKYDNNYHSVYKINYHIVFCIKYRRKVITNEISMRLKEIFLKISPKYKIALMEWEHDTDHIHLLISATPVTELSKFINAYKSASSRLIKKEFPIIKSKLWKEYFWSRSFLVLSVGGASIEVIKKYIQGQGGKNENS